MKSMQFNKIANYYKFNKNKKVRACAVCLFFPHYVFLFRLHCILMFYLNFKKLVAFIKLKQIFLFFQKFCFNFSIYYLITEVYGNNESMGKLFAACSFNRFYEKCMYYSNIRLCDRCFHRCSSSRAGFMTSLSFTFRLQVASKFMPVSSLIIGEWV